MTPEETWEAARSYHESPYGPSGSNKELGGPNKPSGSKAGWGLLIVMLALALVGYLAYAAYSGPSRPNQMVLPTPSSTLTSTPGIVPKPVNPYLLGPTLDLDYTRVDLRMEWLSSNQYTGRYLIKVTPANSFSGSVTFIINMVASNSSEGPRVVESQRLTFTKVESKEITFQVSPGIPMEYLSRAWTRSQ